jgi:2-iminobutanoate/2-iminopropanoate deaminase
MKTIHTDRAPAAIGPYSQAVVVDGWIYCSGQIALDPATGEIVGGGIAEQAERALRNLTEVLRAAGVGLDRVVKTTVFLADMADFAAMNEVYAWHFGANRPARSTIQAAGLPRGCLVEIECVARKGP